MIILHFIYNRSTNIWIISYIHHKNKADFKFYWKLWPKDLTTVAPRHNEPLYNEDPVIANNIWKPGRITVKYMETNYNKPRYNE